MKETARHIEAFEYYVALGLGRSLAKVGQRVGVSTTTTEKWSKGLDWQRRVAERDAKNGAAIAKKTDTEIVKRKSMQLKVVAQAFKSYVDQLIGEMPAECPECKHAFTLRIPGIKAQFRDVDMLVRLQEFLAGEADSHTAHTLKVKHIYPEGHEPRRNVESEVIDGT